MSFFLALPIASMLWALLSFFVALAVYSIQTNMPGYMTILAVVLGLAGSASIGTVIYSSRYKRCDPASV